MTGKKASTIHGFPIFERYHDDRDMKYAKCRNFAVSFLDNEEVRRCSLDSKEFKTKLPKMLTDMIVGVYSNKDIREKVFPDEIETSKQAVRFVMRGVNDLGGQARDLYDFLMMSLLSRVDNTMSVKELKKHIADRLEPYVKFKFKEWKSILTFESGLSVVKEELASEEEETKLRLITNAVNFAQLVHEIFNDLTQTELMNIFGFFLRRIEVDEVKPIVLNVLGSLLINVFKKECDELLDIINEKRKERKHIRSKSHQILMEVKDVTDESAGDTDPFDVKLSDEEKEKAKAHHKATQELLFTDPFDVHVSDIEKAEAQAHHEATQTLLLFDSSSDTEPEVLESEGSGFEDIGKPKLVLNPEEIEELEDIEFEELQDFILQSQSDLTAGDTDPEIDMEELSFEEDTDPEINPEAFSASDPELEEVIEMEAEIPPASAKDIDEGRYNVMVPIAGQALIMTPEELEKLKLKFTPKPEPEPEPESVVEPEPASEPEPTAAESAPIAPGFEKSDFQDTGKIIRQELNQLPPRAAKIVLGIVGATVLIMVIVLLAKHQSKKSQQTKSNKPIATRSSLETNKPPKRIIHVPPKVKEADAAIAQPMQRPMRPAMQPQMRPAPSPGPRKIVVKNVTPPGPKRVNPRPPAPKPDPIIQVKKWNTNIKRIAQNSVNDLPANYTDKYKSLFLGQQINLHGASMTEYIEDAIKEVATRSQWRKFRKYLNGKMKPGWSMYMASINDPWFEEVYRKKYRRWHRKGHRDLKKYEKLKERIADLMKLQDSGKELSKRQKRKLAKYMGRVDRYEEQLRVGKLIMQSLGAVNHGKNVNNLDVGNFSDNQGNVASIVIEMAQEAELEIPEIITAERTKTASPKQPEVQFADLAPESVNEHDPVQAGQDLLKRVEKIEKAKAAQAEKRGQEMEKSVDEVLDRLEISRKFREMAEAREAGPKTEAPIEIERPPVKEEDNDPFDIKVKDFSLVSGVDEDYYAEMTYIKEEPDYTVEITREDAIQNQLAEAEIKKPNGLLSRMGRWLRPKAA